MTSLFVQVPDELARLDVLAARQGKAADVESEQRVSEYPGETGEFAKV